MLKSKLCKFLSVVILATTIVGSANGFNAKAATEYKFDFGGGTVESGYTGVSATMAYSATKGYGFNTPANVKNVSALGSGVASDAVQFLTYGTKSTNTFNVDLPNGLYEIDVTLGNTSRASVAAEGVYQIINMTGNAAKDKFQIPITDGQLNILVTEGKVGTAFTLSALTINKISDKAVTNKTIYIGGDSTACNYYPLDTSVQAGWGQMFSKYVDTNEFQVRNMAASGQCARGFRDDGQFEAILKYIKPGDYFLLDFGINDTAEKNNTTEAQFKEIMRDMVKQTVAKGATIVLVTPQGRSTDFNSSNVHTAENRYYRNSTLALAKEEKVPLVDLNVLSSTYFTAIGSNATLSVFMSGDAVHPNRAGATELARIVAEDIEKQGIFSSPEAVKFGDLNGDGNIDAIDFALMKQKLLGIIQEFPNYNGASAADVNADGSVDAIDMALMKKYLLGAITVFPANQTNQIPTTTFQAEDAYIYNGLEETTNSGYTGESYANYFNEIGSYVEWTVNVINSGNQTLKFRYANGSTADRPMEIKINGNTINSNLSFISTGSWTQWSEVSLSANLNSGNNTIRATSTTSDGGPNVDCLAVTNASVPPTIPFTGAAVYICGDSTVMTYNSSYYPQAGWGQMISKYFNSNVTFVNRAIGGRSSKSFVVEGRLDSILSVIQPNDYLFVQFGHNDATISNAERYAAPYTTYKEYLKKYVDGARAKGAIPVLITPVARLNYSNNTFKNDFPDYCIAMKQVATEENVKLIDLMTLSLNYYASIGFDETYKLYLVSSNGTDYTHFTETGADIIAKLISQQVKKLDLPLASGVK